MPQWSSLLQTSSALAASRNHRGGYPKRLGQSPSSFRGSIGRARVESERSQATRAVPWTLRAILRNAVFGQHMAFNEQATQTACRDRKMIVLALVACACPLLKTRHWLRNVLPAGQRYPQPLHSIGNCSRNCRACARFSPTPEHAARCLFPPPSRPHRRSIVRGIDQVIRRGRVKVRAT